MGQRLNIIWDYADTYLLTPWSRVLLEKLTGSAPSQEIPRILRNPKVNHRTHKGPPLITLINNISHKCYIYYPKNTTI